MSDYHIPVLLKESIEGLAIKPEGTYVDLTFGGGGHSSVILSKLGANGKLYAFDQDYDALRNNIEDRRLEFVKSNFRFLKRYLKYLGCNGVDGVLADLGVSSYQFDEGTRGFSYRFDEKLDMRMNQDIELGAADLLNMYPQKKLSEVFWWYGEVKNARRLSEAIVSRRASAPFGSVGDFLEFLKPFVKLKPEKYWAKVFQALRIEVNDELGALKRLLSDLSAVLNPGARVVVISYHSLEDRIVKRFFRAGNIDGIEEKDMYGHRINDFKIVNRKLILPSEEEMKINTRSRSGRMRVAEFNKIIK